MKKILLLADTVRRLGLRSVARVSLYRLGLRTGLHPALRARPTSADGPFFTTVQTRSTPLPESPVWADATWAFGRAISSHHGEPPDWHANTLDQRKHPDRDAFWPDVSVYSENSGDIKSYWEPSRFDWVLAFAQQAANGDPDAADRLNRWLTDWIANNPPYRGLNWVCAQEASLRVHHLALSAVIMGFPQRLSPALAALVTTHLRRITGTTAYARGQDNNHATSEAAALMIGGWWLCYDGLDESMRREGRRYARQGRRLMEERVARLVFDDGGFAQYSTSYHRLMLDSLSLAELFRLRWDEPAFSADLVRKGRLAARWMAEMIVGNGGDVPNLGANDGAWLLPLGPAPIRDFRPSAALATTLFDDRTAFAAEPGVQALLDWLELATKEPAETAAQGGTIRPDSALAHLRKSGWSAFLRLPGTKFRPSQSDILHLDLWHEGMPVAVDAGSYSYAEDFEHFFASTAAHNTISFDGRDQMPRIGRYLFGAWPARGKVLATADSLVADYRDWRKCSHRRQVTIEEDGALTVSDQIAGPYREAILRWHLASDDWKLEGNTASNGKFSLQVIANGDQFSTALSEAPVSLLYLEKKMQPVLEVRTQGATHLTTIVRLCPSSSETAA